jgi:hypothetical protein
MPLYAQHGHGKSDKLITALGTKDLDGVIFGARNEKPTNLLPCMEGYAADYDTELLFDPQFYVSTLAPPNDRYLPEYPYYAAGRTAADFVGVRKLQAYVKAVLDFERTLPVTRLISPTVLFDSFEDRWCQTALNLADASIDYSAGLKNAPPLLLSFAVSEQALSSRSDLDSFLDQVTGWNAHGIYLIISRDDPSYSQSFDEQRLTQLLYAVYVLSVLNDFEVVNAFTDFAGLLLRAVGATAFGTGWSQGLRQFHKKSFIRRPSGGQPPRFRYSSAPLLNSILLDELQQIFEIGEIAKVLSRVPLDNVILSGDSPLASDWNARFSELHHWQVLKRLDTAMTGDPGTDLDRLINNIDYGRFLYGALSSKGALFERANAGDHLSGWKAAVNTFRKMVNL